MIFKWQKISSGKVALNQVSNHSDTLTTELCGDVLLPQFLTVHQYNMSTRSARHPGLEKVALNCKAACTQCSLGPVFYPATTHEQRRPGRGARDPLRALAEG